MKKREADFGVLLRHYLLAHPLLKSAHLEIKQTITDSFPFSEVKEEQINSALSSMWGPKGNLVRIERGTVGAPDYAYFYHAPAFVVIKFPKSFSFIDIDTFILEKSRSKRKSLTEERAKEIAWKSIDLKKSSR